MQIAENVFLRFTLRSESGSIVVGNFTLFRISALTTSSLDLPNVGSDFLHSEINACKPFFRNFLQ